MWAGGRVSVWIVYPFFTNMFIQACVALCIPYLVSFTCSSSWNLNLHPASCSTISAPCGGVPSCHLGENMWQVEDHHHRLPPSLLGSLARWRCRVLLRVHVGRGDQGITQWGNRRWLGFGKALGSLDQDVKMRKWPRDSSKFRWCLNLTLLHCRLQ